MKLLAVSWVFLLVSIGTIQSQVERVILVEEAAGT